VRVGSLVKRRDDHLNQGVVMEIDPEQTRTDHGNSACRVRWFGGDDTFEFIKMLEILSEGR
jgi:hypothetical protein